jgi:hypothetical protein
MAAVDMELADGRSAIDIFVNKNNGVGLTYDDLILMPGTSLQECLLNERGGMLRDRGHVEDQRHVEVYDYSGSMRGAVRAARRADDCPAVAPWPLQHATVRTTCCPRDAAQMLLCL